MSKGWHERGTRTSYSFGNGSPGEGNGNGSTWIHHLTCHELCLSLMKRVPDPGPYSWFHSGPHLTKDVNIASFCFNSYPLNFLLFKLFLLEGLLLWECILEYFFYFWLLRVSKALSEVFECPHHILQWHILF